jgi:hypothetical protein
MRRNRRQVEITSGGRSSAGLAIPTLAVVAVLVGACGGEPVNQPADRSPSTTAVAAPRQAEPSTSSPSSSASSTTPTSSPPRPSTTARAGQPVYKDGLPQVTTTPSRVTVGGTVRFSGTGFTDSMWRSDDTLWLVGASEGSCAVYAQAEGARVAVPTDGLLEGEFVVPSNGVCRQSQPPQFAEVAPGSYRLAYGCTPCFIGELSVFEAALTPSLDFEPTASVPSASG